MRIRWRRFELPSKVQPDTETKTSDFGRFIVEPFQRGFGHTIGNGLRRVLLSSIEGTAVTAVRIEGADHEFASLEGAYEDVTDIILNIKRLRIRYLGQEPITCRIRKSGKGPVTGADVECEGDAEVVNKDLVIANLTLDREFNAELEVSRGRGYVSSEENRSEMHELGTIPIDSIYSPIHRVRYAVEATRVGKFTNYDRLDARGLDRRHDHARAGADRGGEDLPQAPEPVRALRPGCTGEQSGSRGTRTPRSST